MNRGFIVQYILNLFLSSLRIKMCPSWKFIQNTILYLRTVLFVLPSVKKWAASLRFYFGAFLFIKQHYFLHNLNSTIRCYTTFTNILSSCEPKIYTPIDKCRFHSLSLHCMELKLNQLLIKSTCSIFFISIPKKGRSYSQERQKKKDDYTQTFMSFTFQAYKTRLQASYIGASSDISHISAPTISIIFYCWWFIESQKGLRTLFWRQDWIGRMKRLKLHHFWKSQSHLSRHVAALLRFRSKHRKMSTWLNVWKGSRTFSDSELSFLKTKKKLCWYFSFLWARWGVVLFCCMKRSEIVVAQR